MELGQRQDLEKRVFQGKRAAGHLVLAPEGCKSWVG